MIAIQRARMTDSVPCLCAIGAAIDMLLSKSFIEFSPESVYVRLVCGLDNLGYSYVQFGTIASVVLDRHLGQRWRIELVDKSSDEIVAVATNEGV